MMCVGQQLLDILQWSVGELNGVCWVVVLARVSGEQGQQQGDGQMVGGGGGRSSRERKRNGEGNVGCGLRWSESELGECGVEDEEALVGYEEIVGVVAVLDFPVNITTTTLPLPLLSLLPHRHPHLIHFHHKYRSLITGT